MTGLRSIGRVVAAAVNPQHGASLPPWAFIGLVVVIVIVAAVMFARRRR